MNNQTNQTNQTNHMKKKAAVFTIVKDEARRLPIFLRYYSKYFAPEDIYVLDHNSVDGCCEGIDARVVPVDHEYSFNHEWLRTTVQGMQRELLDDYECVLFAEVDETVYSLEGLNVTIEKFLMSSDQHMTCLGNELVQHSQEQEYDDRSPIMMQRSHWLFNSAYSKTLLSKVPLWWCLGFHRAIDVAGVQPPTIEETTSKSFSAERESQGMSGTLYMMHLHWFDEKTILEVVKSREKTKVSKVWGPMQGCGAHNIQVDYHLEKFKEMQPSLTKIPDAHREALSFL